MNDLSDYQIGDHGTLGGTVEKKPIEDEEPVESYIYSSGKDRVGADGKPVYRQMYLTGKKYKTLSSLLAILLILLGLVAGYVLVQQGQDLRRKALEEKGVVNEEKAPTPGLRGGVCGNGICELGEPSGWICPDCLDERCLDWTCEYVEGVCERDCGVLDLLPRYE